MLQVKQLCGSPVMIPVPSDAAAAATGASSSPSLPTLDDTESLDDIAPLDTEMIQFLVTIENSQEFYSKIVNR